RSFIADLPFHFQASTALSNRTPGKDAGRWMPTTHRDLPKIQGLKRRPMDPRAPARPPVSSRRRLPFRSLLFAIDICAIILFLFKAEKLSWQNEFELLTIRSFCGGTA